MQLTARLKTLKVESRRSAANYIQGTLLDAPAFANTTAWQVSGSVNLKHRETEISNKAKTNGVSRCDSSLK
jgi:hypothetical protein